MHKATYNPFITNDSPFAATWESVPANIRTPLNSLTRLTYIVAVEAVTVLIHVLPAKITWLWRLYVSEEIQSMVVLGTVEKTTKAAYLYQHSPLKIDSGKKIRPVLTCHGDHGDPSNLLPYNDLAKNCKLPTFSLYLPNAHIEEEHAHNIALLKAAIEKIKETIQNKGGIFDGTLVIGHSKGGILAAKLQFVDDADESPTPLIRATCAIGSRLNSVTDEDCENSLLRSIVKKIYEEIQRKTALPLTQLVGKEDWNAPQEAMMVRRGTTCHSVPGMHLSCLYQRDTIAGARQFCSDFLPNL